MPLFVLMLVSLHRVGWCEEKPAIDSRKLDNGIVVVCVHFPASTNVAIFTFLTMGLAADGLAQAQWSHLVEHLVIRSTIPANSPQANAETLPDHMRLDFYGNTTDWREGLSHHRRWLEGVPFTEANLAAEKPKVIAECDFTARNFATHKFALAAAAQGFRHNQKHAALKGDVLKAALAEIQNYRNTRLVSPSNTIVCVVGGVEPAKVWPAAAEVFGKIKPSSTSASPLKVHTGNREMTWDLDARHLVLLCPIPSAQDETYPALFAAAQWLNMQFFGDQEIKKLTGMALAGADLATPEGNYFYLSASLRPEGSFSNVQARIEHHLRRLSSSGADLALLPMLGKQLADSLTNLPDLALLKKQLPPQMTPAMLEMNIGLQWGMNEFRYGRHKAELANRLAGLKIERVRQAAQSHLTASKCAVITLQPAGRDAMSPR